MIVGNDDWHNNYILMFILCKSHIMMSQFLIPTACFFTSLHKELYMYTHRDGCIINYFA